MSVRARAFTSNDIENVAGNQLQAKRGLQSSKGTSNLQRSALGELKITNTRHNSLKDGETFKEPLKPALIRAPKEKENASNIQKPKQIESMDISNTEMDILPMEADPEIEDIDAEDAGNPQLVVEYVNDIYNYLRHVENVQNVKADYLGDQTEILPKMRAVLIDWLIGVHLQFHLLQETLYTTVAILDRYLQHDVKKISRSKLQLVGVASMLIAAKYEEIYAPEVKDFVYITDRAYSERDILRMEIRILSVLNFDLGRPLPLHFLRRASKAGGVEAATHTLAKYIMELSLGSYTMCSVPPSVLAASALALAMRALDTESKLGDVWTSTLEHYTHYSLAHLKPVIQQLVTILVAAPDAKLATVYQKYAHKKFMKISRIPVLEHAALKKIATGGDE
jgi:hypothetical protein